MLKKYIKSFRKDGSIHHSYSVYDEAFGAIEFQYEYTKNNYLIAGIECHYLKPRDYMEENYPCHHKSCDRLYQQECWHDGSSLQADRYIPHIGDEQTIFVMLENRLNDEMESLLE